MERPTMKRAEVPRRTGWRRPMAVVGLIVVGLSAVLVGVAIYACDTDEILDAGGLSDGVRALIAQEKKGKTGKAANPHRHVMKVQGVWNGMTLNGPDAGVPGMAGGMNAVTVAQLRQGVIVASIDPEEGVRAQRAGIRPGDRIVGVDEKKIGGLADLRRVSEQLNAREPLMIQILRQGQVATVVLPAEQPPLQSIPAALTGPSYYCPRDGVLVPAAQAAGGVCPICGGPLRVYNPNANLQGVQ